MALAAASTTTAAFSFLNSQKTTAKCDDEILHPATYPWDHLGLVKSYELIIITGFFSDSWANPNPENKTTINIKIFFILIYL